MTTKCFKLVSGEELLANVVDEDAFQFTLSNPAQIAIQPKEDGSIGLMTVGIPAQALVDEYNSKFEEQPLIQVPDKKIII